MLISIAFTGVNRALWVAIASLFVACAGFQLITFVAFNDESCKEEPRLDTYSYVDCSIDEGSAFAISASLFYLISSIGMFTVSNPRVPLVEFEQGWRVDGVALKAQSGDGNECNNNNSSTTRKRIMGRHEGPSTTPLIGPVLNNPNFVNASASSSAIGDESEHDGSQNNSGIEL